MHWTQTLAATVSSLAVLAGCSNTIPAPNELPSITESRASMVQNFIGSESEAITRIPVSANAFRPMEMDRVSDPGLLNRPLELQFGDQATLQDLIAVLETIGVPVVLANDGITERMSNRLPFSRFNGTFGELLDVLRRSASITARQRGNHVHLGAMARYSVDLPQNKEIMEMIAGELTQLGAQDVVQSVTGGQIIYHAAPDTHDEVIEDFLERISRNLAMVTMQVAIVSLALNDTTNQGFDWNAFRVGIAGAGGGAAENGGSPGSKFDATSTAASIARTASGDIFGRAVTVTVASAINFLSTFGETSVTQNVELRTISGREVRLRSGQEVPYVSGVSSGTENSGGATQTSTVETGLTLTLSPNYDSGTNLMTIDLDLVQRQILQFVELSAGNEIGSITQPLTQDQNLTDLIRMPVGQTVVVGGLQVDNVSSSGTEPSFLRGNLASDRLVGSRRQEVSRNAFFIIVRPTVTVFERR